MLTISSNSPAAVVEIVVPKERVVKQPEMSNNIIDVSYRYNKEIDMVIVTIRHQGSEDVIKQIPSKDFVDMKVAQNDAIGKILDIFV